MEIALVSDLHFGCEEPNSAHHGSVADFIQQILIKEILDRGIKQVIDLGDTFDRDARISEVLLEWASEIYFKPMHKLGVEMMILRGNHNPSAKLGKQPLTLIDIAASKFDNISLIDDVSLLEVKSKRLVFAPYLDHNASSKTQEAFLRRVKNLRPDCILAHLPISGFKVFRSKKTSGGIKRSFIKGWTRDVPILSGHYHEKSYSSEFNITYLGSPYAIYRYDYNVTRGFHVLDIDDLDLEFVSNPVNIYNIIVFDSIESTLMGVRCLPPTTVIDVVVPISISSRDLGLLESCAKEKGVRITNFFRSEAEINDLCDHLLKSRLFGKIFLILAKISDIKSKPSLWFKLIIARSFLEDDLRDVNGDYVLWLQKVFIASTEEDRSYYASVIKKTGLHLDLIGDSARIQQDS